MLAFARVLSASKYGYSAESIGSSISPRIAALQGDGLTVGDMLCYHEKSVGYLVITI
jgi:hypothetical protein